MTTVSYDHTKAAVWVLDVVGLVMAISPAIIFLGLWAGVFS